MSNKTFNDFKELFEAAITFGAIEKPKNDLAKAASESLHNLRFNLWLQEIKGWKYDDTKHYNKLLTKSNFIEYMKAENKNHYNAVAEFEKEKATWQPTNWAKLNAEKLKELNEKHKQAEIDRKKCADIYIDPNFNYSRNLEDFKEKAEIERRNLDENVYLRFLRNCKEVYGNSAFYHIQWTNSNLGDEHSAIKEFASEEINRLLNQPNEAATTAQQTPLPETKSNTIPLSTEVRRNNILDFLYKDLKKRCATYLAELNNPLATELDFIDKEIALYKSAIERVTELNNKHHHGGVSKLEYDRINLLNHLKVAEQLKVELFPQLTENKSNHTTPQVKPLTKTDNKSYSHKQIAIAYCVLNITITKENAGKILKKYSKWKSIGKLLQKRILKASNLTKLSENKTTDTKHLRDLNKAMQLLNESKRLPNGIKKKKAITDITRFITAFETAYKEKY